MSTIDNFANYSPIHAATITLNKTVTLLNFNTTGARNLTVSGKTTGIGGVTIAANHPASPVSLTGPNDYSGNQTSSNLVMPTAASIRVTFVWRWMIEYGRGSRNTLPDKQT